MLLYFNLFSLVSRTSSPTVNPLRRKRCDLVALEDKVSKDVKNQHILITYR